MRAETDTSSIHRPLDLDPKKAGRLDRPPYGIIDIGSNSVRLVVYDQLGRAPLPGEVSNSPRRSTTGRASVLASSRLSIGRKRLRLDVGSAARVPDSESVSDRLSLLAEALGSKSQEITEFEEYD